MSLVVDCDSHVMEPADLWEKWLERRYRDRAIRIERREGVEHLIIGEKSVLSNVLAGLGGAHQDRTKLFTGALGYADGCEPASYEPTARTTMLDAWDVDCGVLFPTIGILPFPTDDQELCSAYCRGVQPLAGRIPRGSPRSGGSDRADQLAGHPRRSRP